MARDAYSGPTRVETQHEASEGVAVLQARQTTLPHIMGE